MDTANALHTWDATYFADIFEQPKLKEWLKKYSKHWGFQWEDGTECDPEGKKVTPHFQIRFSLWKKVRASGLKKIMGDFPGLHFSPTSEPGTKGFNYVMKGKPLQGPWTDQDEGEDERPIPKRFQDGNWKPRPFQREIEEMFLEHRNTPEDDRDDRKINWLMNLSGNIGKSTLIERLEAKRLAFVVPAMDSEKLMGFLMSFKPQTGYIFDLEKAQENKKTRQLCLAMENLKNGRLYEWRYKGQKMKFPPPMVWVMSNQEPPVEYLSFDRLTVWHVNGQGELEKGPDTAKPEEKLSKEELLLKLKLKMELENLEWVAKREQKKRKREAEEVDNALHS